MIHRGLLFLAPGRVNLIGEHTDYNDGYVLPVAIDKYIHIALRERTDRRAILHALDVNESFELNLDTLRPVATDAPTWSYYLIGVASLLQESGNEITGIDAVIIGDVPIGAGLSSSAALSVSAALAFLAGSQPRASLNAVMSETRKKELAALCQRRGARICWSQLWYHGSDHLALRAIGSRIVS